ncbi:transcriptional regulator [Haloterrigena salina JCM 13891]|uniref:Transcriptional regulator n=1 Tax=Haloterrigena salina JCM 13891 TaxID=1227488 RepID=M0CGY4_9EURY|nr:helix-turn-helix domain-containing protein [Haloterrigena salina]ELZ22540.1 transcriptional regulator [Haloterrigena salina JCM 13891]
MADLDDILQDVMEWGQYHAAVYQTLVERGALEPTDVSTWSDVPQGRVYDILDDLYREGAVKKQSVNPTVYVAQHPEKIIDRKEEEFVEKATEAKQQLFQTYEVNFNEDLGRNPAWVVAGRSGVVDQVREQLELAESRIDALEREPWYGDDDIDLLHSCASHGCDVRVVGRSGAEGDLEPLADSEVNVRHSTDVKTSFYLIDDDRVILNIGRGDTGVMFRDTTIATVLATEFEDIYKTATEVTDPDA